MMSGLFSVEVILVLCSFSVVLSVLDIALFMLLYYLLLFNSVLSVFCQCCFVQCSSSIIKYSVLSVLLNGVLSVLFSTVFYQCCLVQCSICVLLCCLPLFY